MPARRGNGVACLAVVAGVLYALAAAVRGYSSAGVRATARRGAVHSAVRPMFPYDCSPPAANTSAVLGPLTAGMDDEHIGFPAWMQAVCPEVVAHFTAYPYFTSTHAAIPVMTTVQAAHIVCTVKIISEIGAGVGTDIMLYHGSLIGALRHGGPIPWDDDADLAMSFASGIAFLEACKAMESAFHPDIGVHCQRHSVFVKVYVQDRCPDGGASTDCTTISSATPKTWRWPYADIFLYRTTASQWQESGHDGSRSPRDHAFPLATVFPVERYYFGGLTLPGPRPSYADAAYKTWKACRTSTFDHRTEAWVHGDVANTQLNCCEAARHVPFVVQGNGGERELVGAGGAAPCQLGRAAGRCGVGRAKFRQERKKSSWRAITC